MARVAGRRAFCDGLGTTADAVQRWEDVAVALVHAEEVSACVGRVRESADDVVAGLDPPTLLGNIVGARQRVEQLERRATELREQLARDEPETYAAHGEWERGVDLNRIAVWFDDDPEDWAAEEEWAQANGFVLVSPTTDSATRNELLETLGDLVDARRELADREYIVASGLAEPPGARQVTAPAEVAAPTRVVARPHTAIHLRRGPRRRGAGRPAPRRVAGRGTSERGSPSSDDGPAEPEPPSTGRRCTQLDLARAEVRP